MYIFKKVIGSFLVPPGLFTLAFLIMSIWLLQRRDKFYALVCLILGLASWLLSIAPIGDALLKPLESDFYSAKVPNGDVIIVLSAGIRNDMPYFSSYGVPSIETMPRVLAAIRLQKQLDSPLIISGRGKQRSQYKTASILKRFMASFDVPESKIIIEDKSKDTSENAVFSLKICFDKGFSDPILVTSAYHLKRALLYFNDAGLNVKPFPSGFETWPRKSYSWLSLLPGDYRKSSIAIHEYLGLIFYRLNNWSSLRNKSHTRATDITVG